MTHIIALDQGTSSSRTIVFDTQGKVVVIAQQTLRSIYPQTGWVEQDPMEIWSTQLTTLQRAICNSGLSAQAITTAGITNQRETTVAWDRRNGQPIYNAIVWQDRRGEPLCARLRTQGLEPLVQQKTGLRIDAYFSATKIHWILEHVPEARALAEQGHLAFGTVDTWLIWQLTQGQRHVTDVSNAARTMLFDIHQQCWDNALLDALNIPASILPEVLSSSADFGRMSADVAGASIPIGGVVGDQQSALFGQACFRAGQAKNTYGTGCFMLSHTGAQPALSANGLLATAAAQSTSVPQYALEGSVFVGGAVVQWLRDGLHAITSSEEVEPLATQVSDSDGVVLVPAFTGLGAPYWDAQARGLITGITRSTTSAHIARAALESIAFQSAALLQAMERDTTGTDTQAIDELRVDGGACVNNTLMQFQADLLGIAVLRPQVVETTAWGAACLAGLYCKIWQGNDELAQLWRLQRRFEPTWTRAQAQARMQSWEHAVRQALA